MADRFDPPYIDVFNTPSLDDTMKIGLLTSRWDSVHEFTFPSRYVGGKFRKIQSHWFIKHTWLRNSKSAGGVFCGQCYTFAAGKDSLSLASVPATDPSNIGKMLEKHSKNTRHMESMEAAEDFMAIMRGERKDIVCSVFSAYNQVVEKNRNILISIVDTIVLCGKQNIALRGHDEQNSNFIALLNYQSKHNAALKDHLENGDPRTKYLSNIIQNELIDICGNLIKSDIVTKCNVAPCFGFIADEATDASTMEQMALCLRYFDTETKMLREDFIGFAECERTTGESLSRAFLDNLREAGVNIEHMRGQGYDGAANMSGRIRGVQTRIREVVPKAVYTHCRAHNLNLAIVHASTEPYVRNMMNTVQEVAFAFNYSAKRHLRFQETLNIDPASKADMGKRRKLQSLCETRWAARADALHTFKAAYGTVVDALNDLSTNYGDTKAATHRMAITQFGFIVSLVAIEYALSALVCLSLLLQKKSCDLIEAVSEAVIIKQQITDERNDISVWDTLYNEAVELAHSIDIEPSRPRAAANMRQQNRQNAPADSTSDFWRRNMYFPFIDHLTEEIGSRLLQGGDRLKAQYLLPKQAHTLTEDIVRDLYTVFEDDMPADTVEIFLREAQRWKLRCATAATPSECIVDTLANISAELYPNVTMCLHVLLAMPVSTASAERSFSSMRRLKSYLRATMSTERMSGLGLMNIHRDREINAELVVDEFARKKERRLALLFRV